MSSNAERRARQRRGLRLLVELDKQFPELPPIDWRISEWSLLGEPLDPDQAKRREVFQIWAQALDLEYAPEQISDGLTKLRAFAKDWHGRRVDVGLTANIWASDETDESAPEEGATR